MPLNRDLFNNANTRHVARSTMAIIDRIQNDQPHIQMAALGAAFVLLAEHWSMNPQEVFTVVKNLMNHADGRRPEFAAVKQYMENEL